MAKYGLKRVSALPEKGRGGGTEGQTRKLIMEFFRGDWPAAEVTHSSTRPGNVRSHLQTTIKKLRLEDAVVATVRGGKVYLGRIEAKKKKREVVLEAGVGEREGRLLDKAERSEDVA